MHRLGTGYTEHFNLKNERTGRLFEGSFKAIIIKKETQLVHLVRYIHINAVDLIEPHWKQKGIKNLNKAISFAENYPWSSYAFYLKKRKSIFIDPSIIKDYYQSSDYHKEAIQEWLQLFNLQTISDIMLET